MMRTFATPTRTRNGTRMPSKGPVSRGARVNHTQRAEVRHFLLVSQKPVGERFFFNSDGKAYVEGRSPRESRPLIRDNLLKNPGMGNPREARP